MTTKVSITIAALLLLRSQMLAQEFPPGYVDPAPILAAASQEIGEANLRCITFGGTGYGGAVGQTFENAVNIDWPRIDALTNYTRTIDWETGHQQGDLRPQARTEPAVVEIWTGLAGRHAHAAATRQTHIVNGGTAWHIDGDGAPIAVPPDHRGSLSAGPVAEPAGFPQGGATARRQS